MPNVAIWLRIMMAVTFCVQALSLFATTSDFTWTFIDVWAQVTVIPLLAETTVSPFGIITDCLLRTDISFPTFVNVTAFSLDSLIFDIKNFNCFHSTATLAKITPNSIDTIQMSAPVNSLAALGYVFALLEQWSKSRFTTVICQKGRRKTQE